MSVMSRAVGVVVRELTPERLDEYLQFFDREAFTDFPHWAGCYCGFYDTPGEEWDPTARAGPAHREARGLALARARRIHLAGDQGAGQGPVPSAGELGAALAWPP